MYLCCINDRLHFSLLVYLQSFWEMKSCIACNTARFVHVCMRNLLILTEFYYYMYYFLVVKVV